MENDKKLPPLCLSKEKKMETTTTLPQHHFIFKIRNILTTKNGEKSASNNYNLLNSVQSDLRKIFFYIFLIWLKIRTNFGTVLCCSVELPLIKPAMWGKKMNNTLFLSFRT